MRNSVPIFVFTYTLRIYVCGNLTGLFQKVVQVRGRLLCFGRKYSVNSISPPLSPFSTNSRENDQG